MRIAILQFSPEIGKVTSNIARADALLEASSPKNLDLLVLPELAFTGYNHPSYGHILPYLEPTSSGPSTAWAKSTAATLNCVVTAGYPELFTPQTTNDAPADVCKSQSVAYNSTVTVAPNGAILAHYRKTHLYYTDDTWAQESPSGWLTSSLSLPSRSPTKHTDGEDAPTKGHENREVKAAFGICMDINPYKFTASWTDYEFCTAAISASAEILVLSMAWLTSLPSPSPIEYPVPPDIQTLSYWLSRLQPLVHGGKEVVVVCANRCGEEPGPNPFGQLESGARYAGTSTVMKIGNGRVHIWGLMSRSDEGVLVVDTENAPRWTMDEQEGEEGSEEDEEVGSGVEADGGG